MNSSNVPSKINTIYLLLMEFKIFRNSFKVNTIIQYYRRESGNTPKPKLPRRLTRLNPSLKSNEVIDASILKLTTDIHECLQLATTPNSTHTTNYPLPNHIKYLIREKRKARSRWQSHKYPPDKLIYNQLKNKLSKALLQHSSFTYNNYIQSLTYQNSSLWMATKKILKTQSTPSPLRNDNVIYHTLMIKPKVCGHIQNKSIEAAAAAAVPQYHNESETKTVQVHCVVYYYVYMVPPWCMVSPSVYPVIFYPYIYAVYMYN
ncbi:hypothetical protein QTP88_014600 [Uroleucon formosanum]